MLTFLNGFRLVHPVVREQAHESSVEVREVIAFVEVVDAVHGLDRPSGRILMHQNVMRPTTWFCSRPGDGVRLSVLSAGCSYECVACDVGVVHGSFVIRNLFRDPYLAASV